MVEDAHDWFVKMWLSTIIFFVVFAEKSTYSANLDCPEQNLLRSATRSKFANQTLVFKGHSSIQFGELVTNYDDQSFTINITRTEPHSLFKGITYISVEVTDNYGKKTYEIDVEGTTNLSNYEVPMREGYVIQIYHAEGPEKLYSQEGIVDITNTTNRWLVTRYGLKNLRLRNDPLYDFVKRLDKQAQSLLDSSLHFNESENIRHLLLAILSLPQPHCSQYLMKYISKFPSCIVQPIIDNQINSGIGGSVDVSLNQDVENLTGTKVQLKRGQDIIVEDTLREQQTLLHFESIDQGVYSVEFRGKSVERYVINPQYIEVKDYIVNTPQFDFVKINCSVLMDNSIEFYGLGDALIGTLRASYEEGSIIMSVTRLVAHDYYGNDSYAVVEVATGDGVSKYRKEIRGKNNTICVDVIPLMADDVIKVHHEEGLHRLKSKNVCIDKSIRDNSWLVTKYGLQNQKLKNDPLDELMKIVDIKAGDIVSNPFKYGMSFYLSEDKKQLLGAIHSLPEPQRVVYLKKYRALFPNRGTFTVSLKLDYPEELAGHTIGIQSEYLNQIQNATGHIVTFNYLPYGYYVIKVPEI